MNVDPVELAGRCEAVARFALLLSAELERSGVIDGSAMSDMLRSTAAGLSFPLDHVEPARRTLGELADAIDAARAARLALACAT